MNEIMAVIGIGLGTGFAVYMLGEFCTPIRWHVKKIEISICVYQCGG